MRAKSTTYRKSTKKDGYHPGERIKNKKEMNNQNSSLVKHYTRPTANETSFSTV